MIKLQWPNPSPTLWIFLDLIPLEALQPNCVIRQQRETLVLRIRSDSYYQHQEQNVLQLWFFNLTEWGRKIERVWCHNIMCRSISSKAATINIHLHKCWLQCFVLQKETLLFVVQYNDPLVFSPLDGAKCTLSEVTLHSRGFDSNYICHVKRIGIKTN